MGTTNIYNWPIPDYPDSADGPSSLGALGRAVETTLNTLITKRVYYTAAITPTVPPGVSNLGNMWPNAGGFVGNANGISVPEAGVYTAHMAITNLSRTVANGLTGVRVTVGAASRAYVPVGGVAASTSYTALFVAGGQLNLQFDNREGVDLGTSLLLNIVKVSP